MTEIIEAGSVCRSIEAKSPEPSTVGKDAGQGGRGNVAYALDARWHGRKRCQLCEVLQAEGLELLFVCNPVSIAYLTGFFHIATERPMGFGFDINGETFAIAPLLERDHLAARCPWLRSLDVYPDYPEADWGWVARRLRERGYGGKMVAVDIGNVIMTDAVQAYLTIQAELGNGVSNRPDLVMRMRQIKDEEEIRVMRGACEYTDYFVGVAVSLLRDGITELEVHQKASEATLMGMAQEVLEIVWTNGYDTHRVVAGRTLFAEGAALPHGPKGVRRLKRNCVVMISYGVAVYSYNGETERTGFFGQAELDDVRAFQAMVEAQARAIDSIRPGVRCCDVHRTAWDTLVRLGYGGYLRHHTGHGKGMESHEPPYLDAGDETILQPGMILSVEPGIYIPGRAGFRHSDTVLVTEDGYEVLSRYPRDLDSLSFKAQ